MLDTACLVGKQYVAVTSDGSQGANLLRRSKAAAQQAVTHQLLQSLTVQHVALAYRHTPDVTGVDQVNKGSTPVAELQCGQHKFLWL